MKLWIPRLTVAGALAFASLASAQQKRPLNWVDMQEMRFASAPSLSPDGKWAVYGLASPNWLRQTSQSDLYLVSTEQGLPSTKRLTLTDDKQEARPVWAPGGKHIVFASNPDGPSQLYIMHPDSVGVQRKITSSPTAVGLFDFSSDGQWLVYRTGRSATDQQLFAMPVSSIFAGGQPAAPRQLTKHATGVGLWRISPDSKRIYFTTPDSIDTIDAARREARFVVNVQDPLTPLNTVWAVDLADGRTAAVARDTTFTVVDFSLSPDGKWVGLRTLPSDRYRRNVGGESAMYSDLYLLETATGRIERLTNTPEGGEGAISFSPDSRLLAFTAGESGKGHLKNRRVYTREISNRGGRVRTLGLDFDGDAGVGFWSADSRTIYFGGGVKATTQGFALDVASGKVRQLTREQGVISVQVPEDARHPVIIQYTDPKLPPNLFAVPTIDQIGERSKWVQLTHSNPQLDAVALGETAEIEWTSKDGAKVGGVLVKPVGYEAGKRYPLLVVLHGGPHAAELLNFNGDDNDGPQVFAGAGYAVLIPNYRGSTNYGSKFKLDLVADYNKLSFEDVMSGVDHVIRIGLVDSARMGVAGHSAGGTLGNWILTHTNRFKAISTGAGVVNWVSMYGTSDFQRPREQWFGDKTPYENFDAYWAASPIRYIRNARTPTLIYSTEGDPRVPSGQARELYTALRRLGVPAELYLYPGAQHGTPGPRNRVAHGIAEMAWMDYYVRGTGKPFTWKDVMATVQPPKR